MTVADRVRAFILPGGIHEMDGHLSGQKTIFQSYDSSVSFAFFGTMSGKNGTILCRNYQTCYVYCYNNACSGLNLTCIMILGIVHLILNVNMHIKMNIYVQMVKNYLHL